MTPVITGRVDDYGRALVPITLSDPLTGIAATVEAWIDTAFTGGLLLTPSHIAALGLVRTSAVPGSLANGSQVIFEAFRCVVHWFGSPRLEAAINAAQPFPLIGIGLLEDCILAIDYPGHTVTLSLSPAPSSP